MSGAAAVDAAADLLIDLDLQPLDWAVIVAGLVCLVVLVLELRRGRGPLTPAEE